MNMQPTFIELPSAPMQEIYHTVEQVADSTLSFFIMGETGVGKEGVAQYIHQKGPRRHKPFTAINCGRFTSELLQSELFGHEAGAFTGANQQRKGALERTNGGILFLDEVVEMPLDAQKLLLRVLDTQTFTRLGGNETLSSDFQVIAATNKDIGSAILKADFRADLYYRFADIMLHVPPLRERAEDISPLVNTFIHEFTPKGGKDTIGITPEALMRLQQAAWPGNIRQLRSTLRTAIALTTNSKLEVQDFPYNFFAAPELEKPVSAPEVKEYTSTVPDFARTFIAIWQSLASETREAIIHEFLTHLPEFSQNLEDTDMITSDTNGELLNIKNMNQHEILREVAQRRIEAYASLNKAARSLGIDIRTLQKHAHWEEHNDAEN